MKRTIWYMYKPGEARDYVTTHPPSPAWVAIQKKDGYVLVSFEVDLPDPAQLQLGTQVMLGPHPRQHGAVVPQGVHSVEELNKTLRSLFVRASGDGLCMECGAAFEKHPIDAVEPWLTVLCDGRRVKL